MKEGNPFARGHHFANEFTQFDLLRKELTRRKPSRKLLFNRSHNFRGSMAQDGCRVAEMAVNIAIGIDVSHICTVCTVQTDGKNRREVWSATGPAYEDALCPLIPQDGGRLFTHYLFNQFPHLLVLTAEDLDTPLLGLCKLFDHVFLRSTPCVGVAAAGPS
jgi:hypothetical protein